MTRGEEMIKLLKLEGWQPSRAGEVRHVVFDYDGTIARVPVDWASARPGFRALVEKLAPEVELAEGMRLDGMEGVALSQRADLKEDFLAYRAELEGAITEPHRPLPAIVDLVKALSSMDGVKLVILSNNMRATVESGLRQLEIENCFEGILGVDDVGVPKPWPLGAELLRTRHGVVPGAAFFVGDSLDIDKVFSTAVGYDFINVADLS